MGKGARGEDCYHTGYTGEPWEHASFTIENGGNQMQQKTVIIERSKILRNAYGVVSEHSISWTHGKNDKKMHA